MQRTNTNFIVKLTIIGLLCLLVFAVIRVQLELNELRKNKEKAINQIEKIKDEIDETKVRLDAPVTDEYIQRVVRDQLGYYNEGDIIFYNDLAN